MAKGVVAVAEGLTNIGRALEQEGYTVVGIDGNIGRVDAVVTSGLDRDMSGVSAISAEVPVIDVSGRTPQEVVRLVAERSALKH